MWSLMGDSGKGSEDQNTNRNVDSIGQADEVSDGKENYWKLGYRPPMLCCSKEFVHYLSMSGLCMRLS